MKAKKPVGRPRKPDHEKLVSITISLPPDKLAAIDSESKRDGEASSAIVRAGYLWALDELERQEKAKVEYSERYAEALRRIRAIRGKMELIQEQQAETMELFQEQHAKNIESIKTSMTTMTEIASCASPDFEQSLGKLRELLALTTTSSGLQSEQQ